METILQQLLGSSAIYSETFLLDVYKHSSQNESLLSFELITNIPTK